jgi:FAD-dependent urate hydroxylase
VLAPAALSPDDEQNRRSAARLAGLRPRLACFGPALAVTTGKHLGTARTGLSLPDGTTSHTMKRADLYQAIRDEASARGIVIQHGKRLVDAEPAGDGVRAIFEDGTDATGDVLMGADGVHSAVRRLIDPDAPAPTYVGLVNLGGYARGVQVEAGRAATP